jgi:hypothetical protein
MGQIPKRANILNISNALPCEVTIDENPGYVTGDFVRLTDLNGMMPIPRGEDPLNNYRWEIIITDTDKFTLHYPVTHKPVDSTNFTPYVTGGYCNLIERNFIYYNDDEE